MCFGAQFSFALYLALFNPIIRKYNVFTVNKWMFTWASLFVLPFTSWHVSQLPWTTFTAATWLEVGYVVVFGTFVSYLLSVAAQRVLRPTVVSVYNYVQPIVSVIVSVAVGLSVFTLPQGVAVILVFTKCLHAASGRGRHPGLLRCVARHQVKVEERRTEKC